MTVYVDAPIPDCPGTVYVTKTMESVSLLRGAGATGTGEEGLIVEVMAGGLTLPPVGKTSPPDTMEP